MGWERQCTASSACTLITPACGTIVDIQMNTNFAKPRLSIIPKQTVEDSRGSEMDTDTARPCPGNGYAGFHPVQEGSRIILDLAWTVGKGRPSTTRICLWRRMETRLCVPSQGKRLPLPVPRSTGAITRPGRRIHGRGKGSHPGFPSAEAVWPPDCPPVVPVPNGIISPAGGRANQQRQALMPSSSPVCK